MEHYDPARRQYAPTSYPTQQPQQASSQTAGPYATPGSVERFRQSNYMQQQSPTAAQAASRASHDAQQLYNFSQGVQYATGTSVPATQLQYGQEYQPQEPRQQTQQYQQYGASVMYNMQQPGQQATATAYEQVPSFRQSRAGAAPETLHSQFEQPQQAQYYMSGQSVPTSAPSSDLAGAQMPSQYPQTAYAQPGPSAQANYTTMLDSTQSAVYSAYSQQSQYTPAQPQQPSDSIDQAFSRYQSSIRTIFTRARDGDLRGSPEQLLQISQYLLGSAEGLGLTRDDEALHDDRIRLWDEFNRAWLTTLQRQCDLTQDMIHTGQGLHESQSLINTDSLKELGRELVRLCDHVEKHGLVDYQMGVAEEDIMDLILRCLSLLEAPADSKADPAARQEGSSAGMVRQR